MEIDRHLILQVILSVAAVAIFIVGLSIVSGAYGVSEPVENEHMTGSLSGDIEDLNVTDESVSGTLTGTLDVDFEGTVIGEIEGTINDEFVGTFNGTVEGAVDGTATGDINGTLDQDEETFDGQFDGTVNGTTDTTITPDGGLVLIGLIAGFIILMPIFGYLIEWQSEDESED